MWEAIASIAGFLAAVAGLVRWLLAVWFKNVRENESLKNQLRTKEIETLKETLKDFEEKLQVHESKMQELEKTIRVQTQEFVKAKDGYKEISTQLRRYVEKSDGITRELRQAIVRLSEDLILIKGTTNAKN